MTDHRNDVNFGYDGPPQQPAPPPAPAPGPPPGGAPIPPLPGVSNAQPLTTPEQAIKDLNAGYAPGEYAKPVDPNHPGSVEEQIERATYQRLTGQPSDPAPQGGGGGGDGYVIDPAALDGLAKKWDGYAKRALEFSRSLRDAARGCTPPAPDPKSMSQARAAQDSLSAAADHAARMHQFADSLAQNFKKTKADYEKAESSNSDDLRRNM